MADEQQGISGFPPDAKVFALEKFEGINTKAARQSIEDQEFSWLENLMPIGEGNLRTLYDVGDSIYTAAGGKIIIFHFFYNIGSAEYAAVFLDDGTADQVNVNTQVITSISATPGTFYNGGDFPDAQQWGNQYLLIISDVASDGYYVWDGSILYGSTTVAPSSTFTITNVGTGYTPGTYALGIAGGGGAGAAGTYTVGADGTVSSIAITNAGSGYTSAPALTFPLGGGASAAATATIMPSGVSGSGIETYQGRVWIAKGNIGIFSAPASFSDFATSSGGGTFTSTDGFLKKSFIQFRQSNGFLYTFADSSINSISNVQTSGSPTTTTFNNINADPQVGTPWHGSVIEFSRALMLANTSGIYAIFGGAAEKISDKLDGLFIESSLPLTGNSLPNSAAAIIFGIRTYLLLIPGAVDYMGVSRPLIAAWDGKKFFIASQSVAFTYISTQEVDSELTCWGTDGSGLYPLFQTPSASLLKTAQAKLWAGDSYIINKQALRAYLQINDNIGTGSSVTMQIDNTVTSESYNFTDANLITFVNNLGGVLQFINNSLLPIGFSIPGIAIIAKNVDIYGQLLGLTMTTQAEDATIISASLLYKPYRGLY